MATGCGMCRSSRRESLDEPRHPKRRAQSSAVRLIRPVGLPARPLRLSNVPRPKYWFCCLHEIAEAKISTTEVTEERKPKS